MKTESKQLITKGRVALIIVIVIGLWLFCLVAAKLLFPDWTVRGQIGDSFGAVNALFSGLAFAGVIITILLQRDELELQRKELELTRKEMENSTDALQKQVEAMKKTAEIHAHSAIIQYHAALAQRNFDQHAAYGSNMREANWHINKILETGGIDKT